VHARPGDGIIFFGKLRSALRRHFILKGKPKFRGIFVTLWQRP
jgi:hypothetical protein